MRFWKVEQTLRAALRHVFALSLVVWNAGCTGVIRFPRAPSPSQREALASAELPRIVVGVRAPVVKLDAGKPADQVSADVVRSELQGSRRLIKALRATKLFERVDFVEYLDANPDVTLISLGPSDYKNFQPGVNLWLAILCPLTACVIPMVSSHEEIDRFARADDPQVVLEFYWPTTELLGLLTPLLLPTSDWDWQPSGPKGRESEVRDTAFAVFLLEHRETIWGERTAE